MLELIEKPLINTSRSELVSRIGNTPLFRINSIASGIPLGVEVLVKAEFFNPGGSVKDRAALNIIYEARRSGCLEPGKTLLDATSGNTGIAYAMIGAALKLPVTVCLPTNASPERKAILRSYGAKIIETESNGTTDSAQRIARDLAANYPNEFVYLDQYNNDANWRAHYNGTGPEIWRQTEGRITHFITGLGTTGTFTGTSRRLKEFKKEIRCLSVQPESPLHGIEGMKHLPSAIVPGIYDSTLVDEEATVSTEDAQEMAERLSHEEGLLVGTSSGANVFAALRLAQTLPPNSVVVTILCDSGERYLSHRR
jgi:S-sulfo-L-cysteine synthase (O-acetyl-L-serine-dependent)